MGLPGFAPGSPTPHAGIITRLDYSPTEKMGIGGL